MVKLFLSSPKGNGGFRYFPCSGYLGLSPIRVEGIVRTKLEDDQKPLLAKSITISIRCYEYRTRVAGYCTNVLVDQTQVLWSKPEAVEYEPIGDLEFPFQISVPSKVAGFSNATFVDYRCAWRIEAVLTHIPITGLGIRQVRHFELSLVRYDIPSWFPSPLFPEPMLNLETNKARTPRIRYSMHLPQTPIGPMDLVSISLHLQPIDKDASIRSASVVVERRIVLKDDFSPPTQSSWTPPDGLYNKSSNTSLQPSSPLLSPVAPNHSSSSTSLLSLPSDSDSVPSPHSSGFTITPDTLHPSTSSATNSLSVGHHSSTKTIVNHITDAQSSGSFSRDQNGVFSKTLTLQWPIAKSRAHWAIGETITSDLVSVKFILRTKIVIASSNGTDTIELADKELYVVSTNEAERQLAAAKYNEQLEALSIGSSTIRPKSKSPRRSKADGAVADDNHSSPSSENSTFTGCTTSDNGDMYSKSRSAAASSASALTRCGKSNRRPHTSAGPRDRPVNFAGTAYGRDDAGTSSTVTKSGQFGGGNAKDLESTESGVGSSKHSKRHSETIMRNVLKRPDFFENHAFTKKSGTSGNDNIANKVYSSKNSGLVSPSAMDLQSFSRNNTIESSSRSASSSGHSIANSFGDGQVGGDSSSQSSEEVREWEEELARIEARSKKSSILFAKRKMNDF